MKHSAKAVAGGTMAILATQIGERFDTVACAVSSVLSHDVKCGQRLAQLREGHMLQYCPATSYSHVRTD